MSVSALTNETLKKLLFHHGYFDVVIVHTQITISLKREKKLSPLFMSLMIELAKYLNAKLAEGVWSKKLRGQKKKEKKCEKGKKIWKKERMGKKREIKQMRPDTRLQLYVLLGRGSDAQTASN